MKMIYGCSYSQHQDFQFFLSPSAEDNLSLLLMQMGKNLQMALIIVCFFVCQ